MIIKYKMFKDSKSFEKFQKSHEIKICGITPMLGALDMEAMSSNKSTKCETSIQVFVTYSED